MENTLTKRVARRRRVPSAGVSAALDVLDVLDRLGEASLSELSRETGAAKSTLHRVCSIMDQRGWIVRHERTGNVVLGPRVAWLARSTPTRSPLIMGFGSVAARLLARHNETTCLAVLDGAASLFVAKEETSHAVRLMTHVGSRLPAFASASGRVLLADLDRASVEQLLPERDLVTPTGRRLEGRGELYDILDRARRDGYAENIDETALGLHCIAVPVGPPGGVAAAITLCVPSGRMTPQRRDAMLADLRLASRALAPLAEPARSEPATVSRPERMLESEPPSASRPERALDSDRAPVNRPKRARRRGARAISSPGDLASTTAER